MAHYVFPQITKGNKHARRNLIQKLEATGPASNNVLPHTCRDMLARLIELQAPLEDFFSHLDRPAFNAKFKELNRSKLPETREWFAMRCLVALLDLIAAVTKV
ncbi:hypothetical protein P3T76_000138 [Phytophthora citrophthora]|uniref:Uncharacterized protein n=1 Tax=Phytophthora citrophthora TaxID=4793 RepID=A0AAD9H0W6_9STRA|nr:hypothetical protein P3T76_000138 [Phytophthora citrophthora]